MGNENSNVAAPAPKKSDVSSTPIPQRKNGAVHPVGESEITAVEPLPQAEENSDIALADKFAADHADDMRYIPEWGRWLVWDGNRWIEDRVLTARRMVKETVVSVAAEIGNARTRKSLCSNKTVSAVETLARSLHPIPLVNEQLDAEPWLLNTMGGLIDLRTGETHSADPSAYCTKICPIIPINGVDSPTWDQFLHQITLGDTGLVAFLQRVAGYCLTGSIKEHAMFFLYGIGGNGKGTFVRALSHIMGQYAINAPITAFTENPSGNQNHPTEIARLRGARLVTTSETEEGRRWAEARIKELTGGDPITARFMRQDDFTFMPQFKLLISGNNKPALRTVDAAIKRRMNLIPFNLNLDPSASEGSENALDKGLDERIAAEYGQILAWMIEGCRLYLKYGLSPPPIVSEATAEYLAEEDSVGRWISDCCDLDRTKYDYASSLWGSWEKWADQNREPAGSQKRLTMNLAKRGLSSDRTRSGRTINGLTVKVNYSDATH